MPVVLAIDQGTTSTRATVVDETLAVRGSAQAPIACRYPQPGWVEQDPDELWRSVLDCARGAIAAAGVAAGDLAGIGLTNQRETTIVWDRASGRALGPAIVWQDRRTAATTAALRAQGAEGLIGERTGLLCDPYFSASKIRWLLEQQDLGQRAASGEIAAGTVDSWLLWQLTGLHRTDLSNAARTSLCAIYDGTWDAELLRLFAVPEAVLGEILPTVADYGCCAPELFGAAVPIRAVVGDQQAALFGQSCLAPGQAKSTYGTGGFVMLQTGSTHSRAPGCLTTVAWQLGRSAPCYALEGSLFLSGALVQWLRDGLGLISEAAEIEALAASVPDSDGVVIVPGHTGLGTPWWDPGATGLIIGCSRGTTRAHLARAALDAMAQQVVDVLEAMASAGRRPIELRVDGGATGNDLLLQTQADLAALPVLRPEDRESTLRGAASFALLGAGLTDLARLKGLWRCARRFEAGPSRQTERLRWRRAVERACHWQEP